MNGQLVNNTNSIEIIYNDLVNLPNVVYKARCIPKSHIVYVAIEKNDQYVEVLLSNGELFQLTYNMFDSPVVENNQQLFDAMKSYI